MASKTTIVDGGEDFSSACKKIFRNAVAFEHYIGNHPLEDLLDKEYRDACFLIRRADFFPKEYSGMIVVLTSNSENFENYIYNVYNWSKGFSYRCRNVIAYGSVKALMMDEDRKEQFGKWKDLIADAFKDGWIFSKFGDKEIPEVNGYELRGQFMVEEFLRKRMRRV